MKVLVIAAHPDDEVLGCGGAISRLAMEDKDVFIAILGEGITSRCRNGETADEQLVAELKGKAEMVAETLGAKKPFLFDFPDNRFDTVPLLKIVKKVEEIVKELKPDVIFTHCKCDLNIDHLITHRAVLTATRPQPGCPVRELHTFEIPSSTEWAFGEFGSFSPNLFLDIGKTIDLKVESLKMYDTEARQFPHPRSPKAIKALARRWGSWVGIEYAEAFTTIRRIL